MLHLTEIKCVDNAGKNYGYFYVNARLPLRSLKHVDGYHVPDALRLVIYENNWTPVDICGSLGLFTYLYRKYIKKSFPHGRRINWEKE